MMQPRGRPPPGHFLRPGPCPARKNGTTVLRFARASAAAPITTPAQDVPSAKEAYARHPQALRAALWKAERWRANG